MGREIVDAALKVHRKLGPGLLESVYEQCLAHELQTRGFAVRRQVALPVVYESLTLDAGYRIDLLVAESVGYLINFNVELLKYGVKRLAL